MPQQRLLLKDTQIVQLVKYPGEDGTSQVLRVRALLDRTLAGQLGCHDNCFAENGMPRHFVDLKLTGLVIQDCEVNLDGSVLLANKVSNFAIGRPKKASSENDPSLEVACNLHFAGNAQLSDWVDRRNKAQFQTEMNPPPTWNAQQSLFDQSDPDTQAESEDGDESGEDIVMPAEEPAAEAKVIDLSDRLAVEDQEPIEANLTGEALERHNEISGASTLAPAATVGGTHQRKRGRARVTEISAQTIQ